MSMKVNAKQLWIAASSGRNTNTIIVHHVNGGISVTNQISPVEWDDKWEVSSIITIMAMDGYTAYMQFSDYGNGLETA